MSHTHTHTHTQFIYLLIDSIHVAEVIKHHVEECRQNTYLSTAKVAIIPESNVPLARDLVYEIRVNHKIKACIFMTEDSSGDVSGYDMPGSMTTRKNKAEMVRILTANYMRPNKIVFNSTFISVHDGDIANIGNIKKEFIRELVAFSTIKVPYKDTFYHKYSGKAVRSNDDLVITLMLGVYMYRVLMTSDRYRNNRS